MAGREALEEESRVNIEDLEEVARRAEEAATEALSRALGLGRSDFFVVVTVDRSGGEVRVAVDVRVRGVSALGRERLEAAVEEAVDAARRAVEEVLGRRGRGRTRGRRRAAKK